MSIASEISRISGNVSDALDAISNKGVTVPSTATSDDLATLIGQISGGGGAAITVTDTTDTHGGIIREITAVNISDTTAVASDVASGKYFYTSAGVKTEGTASGGGGLEYEMGTWTPSEDVAQPTINFANTHSTLPVFIIMADATGTDEQTSYSNFGFLYGSFKDFTGEAVPSDVAANRRYGLTGYVYRTSGNPAQAITGITDLTGAGSYSRDYWVSTTGFIPSSASTSRYWRTGRTYKWIAVWAPTT